MGRHRAGNLRVGYNGHIAGRLAIKRNHDPVREIRPSYRDTCAAPWRTCTGGYARYGQSRGRSYVHRSICHLPPVSHRRPKGHVHRCGPVCRTVQNTKIQPHQVLGNCARPVGVYVEPGYDHVLIRARITIPVVRVCLRHLLLGKKTGLQNVVEANELKPGRIKIKGYTQTGQRIIPITHVIADRKGEIAAPFLSR